MNTNTQRGLLKLAQPKPKFDSISLFESGMILKYGGKYEKIILFSELDKIYLKRHSLHPAIEILCIAFPFLLLYIAIDYLPINLIIIVALIIVPFVFIKVLNYKWYRLRVELKDGTTLITKVSLASKASSISILQKVYTNFLNYNIKKSATT